MSQEHYLKELSPIARKEFLQSNAFQIEDTKYSRPISHEEKSILREKLTDNSIRLSDLKEDFDQVKKKYKEDIDPFVTENKTILTEIRTGQRIEKGVLYHLQNHESGFMESYNEAGELVGTRRLRPDEKQGLLTPLAAAK